MYDRKDIFLERFCLICATLSNLCTRDALIFCHRYILLRKGDTMPLYYIFVGIYIIYRNISLYDPSVRIDKLKVETIKTIRPK